MVMGLEADDVRDQVKIEDIIGAIVPLKKAGVVLKGLCPFHDEKTASLVVWPERQRFRCFGCSEAGDVFDFVQKSQGVDFPTAITLLAERAGIPIPDDPQTRAEQTQWARLSALCAGAALYYQGCLAAQGGAHARHYLERRGISPETSARFGLGYASEDGEAVLEHLRAGGYNESEIRLAGLGNTASRPLFRERLMFPVRDGRGQICGFAGRILGTGQPKYLNSPAGPLYEKGRLLYGLDLAQEAIRQQHTAIVVEGFMDVLRAHQAGFTNVVAAAGTAITAEQIKLLRRSARVVLALDGDTAGQSATLRAGLAAQALCTAQNWGATLHVASLPPGVDPDDLIAQDPPAFGTLVTQAPTLIDHYLTQVTTAIDHTSPRWQQDTLDTLLPVIKTLKGVGLQQHYLERTATLVGIDAATLRTEMDGGQARPAPAHKERPAPLSGPKAIPKAPEWMPPITSDPASTRAALIAACAHGARISEDYALGLLFARAPLEGALLDQIKAYEPCTSTLSPYFAHLARGGPAPQDPAVHQLIAAAQTRPHVTTDDLLLRVVRSCLDRATGERLRLLALEGQESALEQLSTHYTRKVEHDDNHTQEEARADQTNS